MKTDLRSYPYKMGLYLLAHVLTTFKNRPLSEEYVNDLNDMFLYTDEQFLYLVRRVKHDQNILTAQRVSKINRRAKYRRQRIDNRKQVNEQKQEVKLTQFITKLRSKQSVG